MKKTNLIGAMLFAMLTPQLLPAQQQITLHDADGKAFNVLLRKALPVNAPRVRYPGFKQETFILKAGSIRREGTMPLPCVFCWNGMYQSKCVTESLSMPMYSVR
ncbi:hypothetical protein [uncultured Phocaeicola sp.]|uniref:hypothetical protein n=1 Tax=uncultured Phocaeicola sp. TaxID=990718 RepID=UPI0025FAC4C4|nr:hypothetical protein [uncultured Phocaeicola sp.]